MSLARECAPLSVDVGSVRGVDPLKEIAQSQDDLLGLKLPDLSFWEFLKLTPDQLRQELSEPEHAS
jgi:hypothetical protein